MPGLSMYYSSLPADKQTLESDMLCKCYRREKSSLVSKSAMYI